MPKKVVVARKKKVEPESVLEESTSQFVHDYMLDVPYFERIVHVSDIHIRPLQRHEEFYNVFVELITRVGKMKDAIVVVTGDVFDNKTNFKPETVQLCRKFFKELSRKADVVVIPGNHDMLEKNTDRLDPLTPFLSDIDRVHYLKKSGVYHCSSNNISFVVSSLFDKQFVTAEQARAIDKTRKLVALYHGTLTGALTDTGSIAAMEQSSRFRSISEFDGFDAVLLGDIHKHQVLQQSDPCIAYAGSMIQQNHGEALRGHGMLLWECDSLEQPRLVELPNTYGFVDIDCDNGDWRCDHVLPQNCYARLLVKNCTETQVEMIVAEIKRQVQTLKVSKRNCTTQELHEDEIPPDIMRKEDENVIIRELSEHLGYSEEEMLEIHKSYQEATDVTLDDTMSTAVWRINSIEFKNMFGYGGDNVNTIRFRRGLTSIIAGNAFGKTSVVNVVLFGLFGKTPLNPANNVFTMDVVNTNHDSAYIKMHVKHGEVYYIIERKTIRKTKTSSKSQTVLNTKLNRYEFTCDVWLSNIRGQKLEKKTETKKNNNDSFVLQLFGDIKDFSLSNLLNKESSLDLLSMTPSEQVKVLKNLFKIDIYDTYREMNKAAIHERQRELDTLQAKKHGLSSLLEVEVDDEQCAELELKVEKLESELSVLVEEKEQLEQELKELEIDRALQRSRLDEQDSLCDFNFPDKSLSILKSEKEKHQAALEELDVEPQFDLKSTRSRRSDLKEEYKELVERMSKLNETGKMSRFLSIWEVSSIVQLEIDDVALAERSLDEEYEQRNIDVSGLDRSSVMQEHSQCEVEIKMLKCEGAVFSTDAKFDLQSLKDERSAVSATLVDVSDFDYGLEEIDRKSKRLRLKMEGVDLSDVSIDQQEQEVESLSRELESKKVKLSGMECPVKGVRRLRRKEVKARVHELTELQKENGLNFDADKLLQELSETDEISGSSLEGIVEGGDDDWFVVLPVEVVDSMIEMISPGKFSEEIDEMKSLKYRLLEIEIKDLEVQLDKAVVVRNALLARDELESLDQKRKKLEHNNEVKKKLELIDENIMMAENVARHKELSVRLDVLSRQMEMFDIIAEIETVSEARTIVEEYCRVREKREAIKVELKVLKEAEKKLSLQQLVDSIEEDICIHESNDDIKVLEQAVKSLNLSVKVKYDDVDKVSVDVKRTEDVLRQSRLRLETMNAKKKQVEELKGEFDLLSSRIVELEKDLVPLNQYSNLVGSKGITSKILFSKIKTLEEYINTIIKQFTKYKIIIMFDETKQTMSILTQNKETQAFLSTSRLSGYEKLMLQIAFKRALNKFSYNSKSSLVIIDEAFDCIDQDNFTERLPEVINLITQDYSTCLAISQRDITHVSDSEIQIVKDHGHSVLFTKN